MKKIFLFLVIFAFGSLYAFSQDEEQPSNRTVVWGIKANLGAELPSKFSKDDNLKPNKFNSGFGASIGGLANVYLGKNFYFEPEIALFYEGYSYDNVRPVAPNSPSVNVGPTIHKFGVDLPLNIGYFINISEKWGLNVFTGPKLSYAFYGNSKSSAKEDPQIPELLHVFKGPYAQNRFGLGWDIGIGFPVENFMISLEADLGITDMMKGKSLNMRENLLSLGITYYFL